MSTLRIAFEKMGFIGSRREPSPLERTAGGFATRSYTRLLVPAVLGTCLAAMAHNAPALDAVGKYPTEPQVGAFALELGAGPELGNDFALGSGMLGVAIGNDRGDLDLTIASHTGQFVGWSKRSCALPNPKVQTTRLSDTGHGSVGPNDTIDEGWIYVTNGARASIVRVKLHDHGAPRRVELYAPVPAGADGISSDRASHAIDCYWANAVVRHSDGTTEALATEEQGLDLPADKVLQAMALMNDGGEQRP